MPGLDAAGQDTDELAAVAEFIGELVDLEEAVGDELGEARSYVPERWRVVKVYDTYLDDVDVPEWPLDGLPVIDECVELPTASDCDTASGPYSDGGATVAAEALLPWETC